MNVQVKANNNFNKPFGIEAGNVYKAEKVETKISEPTVCKNKLGYSISVSYTIGGMNFDSQDFTEI